MATERTVNRFFLCSTTSLLLRSQKHQMITGSVRYLARGRGCKGGPGYRGPRGCVGWRNLISVCGPPPSAGCTRKCTIVEAGCNGRSWLKDLAKSVGLVVTFVEADPAAERGAAHLGGQAPTVCHAKAPSAEAVATAQNGAPELRQQIRNFCPVLRLVRQQLSRRLSSTLSAPNLTWRQSTEAISSARASIGATTLSMDARPTNAARMMCLISHRIFACRRAQQYANRSTLQAMPTGACPADPSTLTVISVH